MSAPDFTHGKPAILFTNLKQSAELISKIHQMDGTIANWTDRNNEIKEIDRLSKELNDGLNDARRGRKS